MENSTSHKQIYLKIFEHSQDSIFLIDPSGDKIIFANPRAIEDTAYEIEELEGMNFKLLFTEENQAAISTLMETTIKWNTGTDPQRDLMRKSGRKIIVEIATSVVEFAGENTIFCNVKDITQRIKSEKKILQYSEELEKINLELEDRVKERTKELAGANDQLKDTNKLITAQKKEIDDIMANIKQAIFTISSDMTINPDYSQFSHDIFGKDAAIAKIDITELLYSIEEQESEKDELKQFLGLSFEDPSSWDLTVGLFPTEVKINRCEEDGSFSHRDLRLEWCPINVDEEFTKIMIVGTDITLEKQLEAEIAQKDKEHNAQLELLSQLISMPTEIVDQFVQDSKRHLSSAQATLEKLTKSWSESHLQELMRNLHTVKGVAGQFNFDTIKANTHSLESEIVEFLKEESSEDKNNNFFSQVTQSFSSVEKELQTIFTFYEKVIAGKQEGQSTSETQINIPTEKISNLIKMFSYGNKMVQRESVSKALEWLTHVPVRTLFDRLEQLANSLAVELEKEVEVMREGDHLEVNMEMIGPLYDAFLHVIRNSLDHGVELPDEREKKGKNRKAKIKLEAYWSSQNQLIFKISDDGAGINLEKIKKKAVGSGLITKDEMANISREEMIKLVFLPGFSSKRKTTELSGRGVGLDVVKEVIENNFSGSLEIRTTDNEGSCLIASIPPNPPAPKRNHYIYFEKDDFNLYKMESDLNVSFNRYQDDEEIPSTSSIITKSKYLEMVPALSNSVICLDELEPSEIVEQVLVRHKIKHFVSLNNNPKHIPYLRACFDKISKGLQWGIEPYLYPGRPVISHTLTEYSDKNQVIDHLLDYLDNLKIFSDLKNIVGLIADEMIMNGMFDAPRDENGKPKYNHLARTHKLVLEDKEAVTFRYGADSNFIAISIEDPFGALDYDTLINYLEKCYCKGPAQINDKKDKAGAGLGLYSIFNYGHAFIVNCAPNKKTEIICLIVPTTSHGHYERIGKSFGYFLFDNE